MVAIGPIRHCLSSKHVVSNYFVDQPQYHVVIQVQEYLPNHLSSFLINENNVVNKVAEICFNQFKTMYIHKEKQCTSEAFKGEVNKSATGFIFKFLNIFCSFYDF